MSFDVIDENGDGSDEVAITVNGVALVELVRVAQQPWADRDGNPDLAGSYVGLSPWDIRGIAAHFLDDPQALEFEDGDTVLLGCGCGTWGCWPLTTDILLTDDEVTWTHFRQGFRDWDLSDLGPFTFDRAAYERGLGELDLRMSLHPSGVTGA